MNSILIMTVAIIISFILIPVAVHLQITKGIFDD
jgi:hypothetical protein